MLQTKLNFTFPLDRRYRERLAPLMNSLMRNGFDNLNDILRLCRMAENSYGETAIRKLRAKLSDMEGVPQRRSDILRLKGRINTIKAANGAAAQLCRAPSLLIEGFKDVIKYQREVAERDWPVFVGPDRGDTWVESELVFFTHSWDQCVRAATDGHGLVTWMDISDSEDFPEISAVFTRLRYHDPVYSTERTNAARLGLLRRLKGQFPAAAAFKFEDVILDAPFSEVCPNSTGAIEGRKWGQCHDYIGYGFVWGDDTRILEQKQFCKRCERDAPVYQVNFPQPSLSRVIFCLDCDSIISKPVRLGVEANGVIEVTVEFSDGSREISAGEDYCRSRPVNLFHCGVEMARYQSYQQGDVLEQIFECPQCLQEKLLKHFSFDTPLASG